MATTEGTTPPWYRRVFAERPVLTVAVVLSAVLVSALIAVPALWWTGAVEPPAAVRGLMNAKPKQLNLVLVVPRLEDKGQYEEGVRMALDEVNAAGGIDELPVELEIRFEDTYSEDVRLERVVADTLALADQVVSTKDLLAVLGHWSSTTALPASSVYNRRQVLYLAAHARASSLTNRGFDYVFALLLNNADNASMMAHYAVGKGMKRFVVLSDDTEYGFDTTNLFTGWATELGAEILYHGSVTSHRRSIDRLILFFLNNNLFAKDDIDAFFITSSSILDTARFIKRARELGLTMPILGPGYIFSSRIEDYVDKEKMKDVAGVSLFDESSVSPKATDFVAEFKRIYGRPPDQMSAIGYDAVNLLAYSVRKANSRDPTRLADWLRIMRHEQVFVGVTGPLVFDVHGRVTDTDAFIVRHDGTEFRTVARYRKPLDWDPVSMSHRREYRP